VDDGTSARLDRIASLIFDGGLFWCSHRYPNLLPVVRAEAAPMPAIDARPPSLAHELATGTRHLMPVGQSGRTPSR